VAQGGCGDWYRYLFMQRLFLHAVYPLADFVASQQFQINDRRACAYQTKFGRLKVQLRISILNMHLLAGLRMRQGGLGTARGGQSDEMQVHASSRLMASMRTLGV
jgi:hypothetical protein